MRIKFLEQMKFRLQGRAVRVLKCDDVEIDGLINTVQFAGLWKIRGNSILNTWDAKGEEIQKDSRKIILIDSNGISEPAYVVHGGKTVNLYTEPSKFPNREDIIGKASTMDDIADAMDLGKSMRNTAIGFIIGTLFGWLIFGPMIGAMLG